jgi:hypothetical protein
LFWFFRAFAWSFMENGEGWRDQRGNIMVANKTLEKQLAQGKERMGCVGCWGWTGTAGLDWTSEEGQVTGGKFEWDWFEECLIIVICGCGCDCVS